MLTPDEMRAKLVDRAAEDAEFRARLLSDPKGAVEEELELTIPPEFNVQVHEDGGNTAHIVLPPSSKLGEADLNMIGGGSTAGLNSQPQKWNPDEW